MRNLMSYGTTLIILLAIGIYMLTGTYVEGGRGPGNGEQPIVSLIEPDGGPLTELKDTIAPESMEVAEGEEIDPSLTIAERNAVSDEGEEGPLRSVRIAHFDAKAFPIEVTLRGNTEASSTISAAAQTSGLVDEVHVEKGDTVSTGDLLCTIDRGTREATVSQARASLEQANSALDQAQANFENNKTLREKGVVAANTSMQFEVALNGAEAQLSAAQAALDNALTELDRTEVRARSAGIITEPIASVGDLMNMGSPCATIVELNPILFVGSIPEARISLARLGFPVHVETVAGDSFDGTVTYISPVADTATRSFRVEVSGANDAGTVRDGLTAAATVNAGAVPAQLLPQSVLTLGPDGDLGIRAVENGVVAFYPVSILSDTRDGVWVTGLPASVDVITLGQENVVAGQKVDARPFDQTDADSMPAETSNEQSEGTA